jgi:hypothetical protein
MSLIPISSVFPIHSKWSLLATSSDNTPKPRLGLLTSDRFLSIGLSVVGSVYLRVALEAALDEVGLVFVTRVRLRSWYGIAEWFKWVKLDPSVALYSPYITIP